jgi:hypothetical protein
MGDLVGHFVITAAHESLYRHNGVYRVGNSLTFGRISDLSFPILKETHYGRGRTTALVIGDHYRLIAFQDSHATIRRAEVNSYDFSHIV